MYKKTKFKFFCFGTIECSQHLKVLTAENSKILAAPPVAMEVIRGCLKEGTIILDGKRILLFYNNQNLRDQFIKNDTLTKELVSVAIEEEIWFIGEPAIQVELASHLRDYCDSKNEIYFHKPSAKDKLYEVIPIFRKNTRIYRVNTLGKEAVLYLN